jgi:hypothetical protein
MNTDKQKDTQVYGGRTAIASDNSLWSINTKSQVPSWNLLMPSGSSDAPSERQRFASVMIRSSLVLYGGQGSGNTPLSDILVVDLCKTGESNHFLSQNSANHHILNEHS